jgi:ubiquinone biosynthesis protein Coq4
MGKTKLRFFGNYWNELWFNNLGWWRWRLKMAFLRPYAALSTPIVILVAI